MIGMRRLARSMVRSTIVALLAATVLVTWALACTCIPQQQSVSVAFESSKAVFEGVVESITEFQHLPPDNRSLLPISARLKVVRIWKGLAGDTVVVVHTYGGSGSCGFPFKTGARHLIYASRGPVGTLVTNSCTRSGKFPAVWADSVGLDSLEQVRLRR